MKVSLTIQSGSDSQVAAANLVTVIVANDLMISIALFSLVSYYSSPYCATRATFVPDSRIRSVEFDWTSDKLKVVLTLSMCIYVHTYPYELHSLTVG